MLASHSIWGHGYHNTGVAYSMLCQSFTLCRVLCFHYTVVYGSISISLNIFYGLWSLTICCAVWSAYWHIHILYKRWTILTVSLKHFRVQNPDWIRLDYIRLDLAINHSTTDGCDGRSDGSHIMNDPWSWTGELSKRTFPTGMQTSMPWSMSGKQAHSQCDISIAILGKSIVVL